MEKNKELCGNYQVYMYYAEKYVYYVENALDYAEIETIHNIDNCAFLHCNVLLLCELL